MAMNHESVAKVFEWIMLVVGDVPLDADGWARLGLSMANIKGTLIMRGDRG